MGSTKWVERVFVPSTQVQRGPDYPDMLEKLNEEANAIWTRSREIQAQVELIKEKM